MITNVAVIVWPANESAAPSASTWMYGPAGSLSDTGIVPSVACLVTAVVVVLTSSENVPLSVAGPSARLVTGSVIWPATPPPVSSSVPEPFVSISGPSVSDTALAAIQIVDDGFDPEAPAG